MKKKHTSTLHLLAVSILALAFFGLLFVSTSQKYVTVSYTFEEEVHFTPDVETDFVGFVTVTNEGLLTKKVTIPEIQACEFSDNGFVYSYYVYFEQEMKSSLRPSYFYGAIEVPAGEEMKLRMYTSMPYELKRSLDDGGKLTRLTTLHLYQEERGNEKGCQLVEKEDAFHLLRNRYSN